MAKLSKSKARKILKDGKVRGKKLTPKQRRYMGAVVSGYLRRGGYIPTYQTGGYSWGAGSIATPLDMDMYFTQQVAPVYASQWVEPQPGIYERNVEQKGGKKSKQRKKTKGASDAQIKQSEQSYLTRKLASIPGELPQVYQTVLPITPLGEVLTLPGQAEVLYRDPSLINAASLGLTGLSMIPGGKIAKAANSMDSKRIGEFLKLAGSLRRSEVSGAEKQIGKAARDYKRILSHPEAIRRAKNLDPTGRLAKRVTNFVNTPDKDIQYDVVTGYAPKAPEDGFTFADLRRLDPTIISSRARTYPDFPVSDMSRSEYINRATKFVKGLPADQFESDFLRPYDKSMFINLSKGTKPGDLRDVYLHEKKHLLTRGNELYSDDIQDEILDLYVRSPHDMIPNTKMHRMLKTDPQAVSKAFSYFLQPTEFAAFISTNMRDRMVRKGILKNHWSKVTEQDIKQLVKSLDDTDSVEAPIINALSFMKKGSSKKLANVMNKMLPAVGAGTIMATQQNSEYQTGGYASKIPTYQSSIDKKRKRYQARGEYFKELEDYNKQLQWFNDYIVNRKANANNMWEPGFHSPMYGNAYDSNTLNYIGELPQGYRFLERKEANFGSPSGVTMRYIRRPDGSYHTVYKDREHLETLMRGRPSFDQRQYQMGGNIFNVPSKNDPAYISYIDSLSSGNITNSILSSYDNAEFRKFGSYPALDRWYQKYTKDNFGQAYSLNELDFINEPTTTKGLINTLEEEKRIAEGDIDIAKTWKKRYEKNGNQESLDELHKYVQNKEELIKNAERNIRRARMAARSGIEPSGYVVSETITREGYPKILPVYSKPSRKVAVSPYPSPQDVPALYEVPGSDKFSTEPPRRIPSRMLRKNGVNVPLTDSEYRDLLRASTSTTTTKTGRKLDPNKFQLARSEEFQMGGDIMAMIPDLSGIAGGAAAGEAAGAGAAAGGLGAMAGPLGNLPKIIGNTEALISAKGPKGRHTGALVGSGADAAANLIPGVGPMISQLGVGEKLGTFIGKALEKDQWKPNPTTPSGNTAGNFRDYKEGGQIKGTHNGQKKKSWRKGKKMAVWMDGKWHHFGDSSMQDYRSHKSDKRKANYYSRHAKNLKGNSSRAKAFRSYSKATWQNGGQLDSMYESINPYTGLIPQLAVHNKFYTNGDISYPRLQGVSTRPIVVRPEDILSSKQFQGGGYAYDRAKELGYTPDSTGHWPSRDYVTGQYLKAPNHPTTFMSVMTDELMGGKVRRDINGNLYSIPRTQQYPNFDLNNPPALDYKQEGGNVNASAEIEGGEYVFDPQGISEQNFKMADNTGTKYKSPFGFQVKGDKHNKGGIQVESQDGYIASAHLGVDGKKASSKNPSVAKSMLDKGGKALARGNKRTWDKFGINEWNPGAMKHHLDMMADVRDKAETGKIIEEIRKMLKDKSMSREEKKLALSQLLSQVSMNNLSPEQMMSGPMF